MWTSKRVGTPCPACAGALFLTLTMVGKEPGTFSLAGAQVKFSAEVKPKLYCVGMTDPPLGGPMWEPCGWWVYGTVVDGDAVFANPLV